MKQPRPSSEPCAGLFVTIDGPSGVGKTTTMTHLARLLKTDHSVVHFTVEPSRGPIGQLAYNLTDTVTGPALACLYAADRYHHLQAEVRPALASGHLVVCDRYVPSALVMQRLDSLDLDFLWNLNSLADRPDLSIILTATSEIVAARLKAKGAHNRLQLQDNSSTTEVRFYEEARQVLHQAGYQTIVIDTSHQPPRAVAARVREAIRQRHEQLLTESHANTRATGRA
ncbi:dTMP kinase [Kribbella sp. NPDC026611]|uniref:dTMP kinase n=1 Tax=Kribbella sp. NPDC026611 TaxID=3154911 RepID=UPI0033EF227A